MTIWYAILSLHEFAYRDFGIDKCRSRTAGGFDGGSVFVHGGAG